MKPLLHDTLSIASLAALAFTGLMARFKFPILRPCSLCDGEGVLPLYGGGYNICLLCCGSGKKR